ARLRVLPLPALQHPAKQSAQPEVPRLHRIVEASTDAGGERDRTASREEPRVMEPLLFLAHRLPYPPNKGDKVRSYHFLRHLAQCYRVFLGTFIDDPADEEHVPAVRSLCAEVHVEPLTPWRQRARSLGALIGGEALTLPYFRSRRLAAWSAETAPRHAVLRSFFYSSAMPQYALGLPRLDTFVDFVDMDSAKWDDYASRRGWPA